MEPYVFMLTPSFLYGDRTFDSGMASTNKPAVFLTGGKLLPTTNNYVVEKSSARLRNVALSIHVKAPKVPCVRVSVRSVLCVK